jgi:hypothetical protein
VNRVESGGAVTPADIIEAIRRDHLTGNISDPCYVRHHWDRAWLDRGVGEGPYVQLPVNWLVRAGSDETEEVVIRVYPPAQLRRRLQRAAR